MALLKEEHKIISEKLTRHGLTPRYLYKAPSFQHVKINLKNPEDILEKPRLLHKVVKEGFQIFIYYGPWDSNTEEPRRSSIHINYPIRGAKTTHGFVQWWPRYTYYKRRQQKHDSQQSTPTSTI